MNFFIVQNLTVQH